MKVTELGLGFKGQVEFDPYQGKRKFWRDSFQNLEMF